MKLAAGDILNLLPEHLSGDPQFAAAGAAANPFLRKLATSIPNLLVWARLGNADPASFLPPLRRLTEARPGLAPLDMETLESLAWQFHVDFREAARTKEELAGMVLNSIAWHRIKGTPASIYAALKLCGFSGIKIEEHTPGMPWATYQLGFAEIAEMDDLARIVAICQEMQPARCRLWRVYVDDYDMRPGVWSGPIPPNTWSNCWWSYYSGSYFPDLPGLGDDGLMVSFGLKRKFQSEPWSSGDYLAWIWQTRVRSWIIRRINHYIWSESRWSDLYPMRRGFFGSALYSAHFADLVCDSGTWEQPDIDLPAQDLLPDIDWTAGGWANRAWGNSADFGWAEFPWAKRYYYDRLRPAWSMLPDREIFKSQGVYSDTSDKISGWSRLNCNWSWPVITIVRGHPPLWSGSFWSGEGSRVEHVLVREQFLARRASRVQSLAPAIGRGAVFGAQVFSRQLRWLRSPVWGESHWGDLYQKRHGFCQMQLFSGHFAELICDSGPWGEDSWEEGGWVAEYRYDRPLPAWRMLLRGLARSQGVYSAGTVWSGHNANWSLPHAAGSPVLEQERTRHTLQTEAFSPAIGDQNFAAGESRLAARLVPKKAPIWSATDWSDSFPQGHGFSGESLFSAQTGEEYLVDRGWAGGWDEAPWREVAGFGCGHPPVGSGISSLAAMRAAPLVAALGGFAVGGIEAAERQWDGGWDSMSWDGEIL